MKRVFHEFGGTIIKVIAIVTLIAFVTFTMSSNGVIAGAFGDLVWSFVDTSGGLLDSATNGTGGSGGSGGAGGEGVDEPTSAQLDAPVVSLDGTILSISPVEYATSYEVYNGSELLVTTTETTLDLAGYLTDEGEYVIGIKAVASGYASSEQNVVLYTVASLLPALGTPAEDCTWEQIKAISAAGKADEYFNLGDTKTITLEDDARTTMVMEIVAFGRDVKADGTGYAGITWIAKDIVAKHSMNSTSTNNGGWEKSAMRSWLQSEFYQTIPKEVRDVIVIVNKTYFDYSTKLTKTAQDTVWLPSYLEVFGTGFESSGASYTEYFTSNDSRSKTGLNCDFWWLRTASSGISRRYRVVESYRGIYNDINASSSMGVVPGFCV